ncbi:MAG TPA: septum formation initiator family protein [Rhodobacteraceae bacterium]|nr:septum formation initiator family protein [Paracoccaceae bacterium]
MNDSGKSRNVIGYLTSVSVVALVAYFSYSAIQGPYGMLTLFKIETKEAQLQMQLDVLRQERAIAANRAYRLSDEYLDLDLLDEQARKVLGFIRGDEIIVQ